MYLAPIPHNLASPGRLSSGDRHPTGLGMLKGLHFLAFSRVVPTIVFEVRFLSFRELLKRNVDNEATSLFSKTGENLLGNCSVDFFGYFW